MAEDAGPRRFSEIQVISDATLKVVEALGFTTTTPVQDAVIPLFCGHKDVAVDACTGSGKTLAFVIPIVEKLRKLEEALRKHQVGAVVVSPTRELARQIFTVAQPFVASVPGLTSALLVGGTDPGEDVAAFKEHGGHVLVGTPGRLDDMMKRCGTMDFKRLEVLVLDEADRLLDMGFRQQLDAIMARLPKQRRTGLFSATQTEAVQALARAGLRNPVRVNVAVAAAPAAGAGSQAGQAGASQRGEGAAGGAGAGEEAGPGPGSQRTPNGLSIQYAVVEVDAKLQHLVRFLQQHGSSNKVIVYCLTCACVDFYSLALKRLGPQLLPGLQVKALHGRMKQSMRESTLAAYTALASGVLLATDVAARGLDIPEVHWVLQVDPPQDPAAFVHRVGRTARAGRTGQALVMLAPHELSYVAFLRVRKVPLTEAAPMTWPSDAPSISALMRREAETDREVMEAGSRAFVSYVRGYKEHHCKFIFQIQDLPMGRLATAFALLRLPHMPEVKRALHRSQAAGAGAAPGAQRGLKTLEHFTPSSVEPDSVKFKDKTREKQRQQVLKQRASTVVTPQAAAAQTTPKAKQAAGAALDSQQHASGERMTAQKRRKLQARDELAELAAEYSLLKRMRKGKMSEHEFDRATGLVSDDDDDGGAETDDSDAGGGSRAAKRSTNGASCPTTSSSGRAAAGSSAQPDQTANPAAGQPTGDQPSSSGKQALKQCAGHGGSASGQPLAGPFSKQHREGSTRGLQVPAKKGGVLKTIAQPLTPGMLDLRQTAKRKKKLQKSQKQQKQQQRQQSGA